MTKPRKPGAASLANKAPVVNKATMPPAHKHGATWWGRRWIEALEHGSRDMVVRLGKGRAYARDGHVHHLKVLPGKVTATVTDDELESHQVTLTLEAFDSPAWRRILHAMASQALNAAQLLNGEMPKDIDQVFRSCGKSLFPVDHHEIDADCSCEDWTSPCKHVAATYYVLGDALDRDPFLLFELRGRSKEQVLGVLDRARQNSMGQINDKAVSSSDPATQLTSSTVTLDALQPAAFERSDTALPVLRFDFNGAVGEWSGKGTMNGLMNRPANQPVSLLRSLGKPASWTVPASPAELLEPALIKAGELALEWASASGHIQLKEAIPGRRKSRRRSSSSP